MIQPFEQEEFRGLALVGDQSNDPYTSRMELNTETDESGLNRIKGRQPYIVSKLPANAIYFDEHNRILEAKSIGVVNQISLPYVTASFNACVCFRWEGVTDVTASVTTRYIFGDYGVDGSNPWSIEAVYSASRWTPQAAILASGASTYSKLTMTTVTIAPSTWYWADLRVINNGTATLSIFVNGSVASTESVVNATLGRVAITATGHLTMGGFYASSAFDKQFWRGAVSYAGVGTGTACPPAWEVKIARSGQTSELACSFCVQNPNEERYIAKIYSASTAGCVWLWQPERRLHVTVDSGTGSLYDGLSLDGSDQIEVDVSNVNIFRQTTVFLMDVDADAGYCPFVRSEDSTFRIEGFASADYQISVTYNPEDEAYGSTAACRQHALSLNYAASASIGRRWLAFEFIPNQSASVNNVFAYEYTAATWTALFPATATSYSKGILPPEANRFILGGPGIASCTVFDFRISIGDDAWKDTNIPTATVMIPSGLVTWFYTAPNKYPRDENVQTVLSRNSNRLLEQTSAIGNRIDGEFDYKLISQRGFPKYTGCPYIVGGFLPTVEDIADLGSGDIFGVTDGYYFDTSAATSSASVSFTIKPTVNAHGKTRRRIVNVGINKYVCGNGHLQFIGGRTRNVGFANSFLKSIPGGSTLGSESSATLAHRGSLTGGSTYKIKHTIYNPENSDESNAYGPFRFVPSGTDTDNAFSVHTYLYTNYDAEGLEIRTYRYSDGDGKYHLEGSSKIGNYRISLNVPWSEAQFTCTMSDDDLVLQPELHTDDHHIPEHTYCYVWNNRSWFVDAYNTTRVYFSKAYEIGNVPTTNLLWTDEGVGGEVLGLTEGFGGLLVLKERSIWIIPYFDEDKDASCQQLIPDVGVVGGDAALFVDGILYFASADGLYVFNGQTTTRISEGLNKADLKVWDHDPRSTRAMYDRRNFKIKFCNDGTYVSIDVRNGAIRLGADNDKCVTNIACPSYAGPIYGGTGGVFKECSAHVNRGLLGITAGMPTLVDEFAVGTQQNFNTATAALVEASYQWYSINGDKLLGAFDVASTYPGQLVMSSTPAAGAFQWSHVLQSSPGIFRKLYGNFDINIKPFSLSTTQLGNQILAFQSSDLTNYVRYEAYSTVGPRSDLKIDFWSSTGDNNTYDFASVSGGETMELRLERIGTTFTPYYYSASTWVSGTPVTAVLSDPIYVGPSISNYVGARSVEVHISWFHDTRIDTESASITENAAVYGPVDITASGYTASVSWGYGYQSAKRVGSIFPIWTHDVAWLGSSGNSLVGREIYQWNDVRDDIWSTILHAVENQDSGVFYFQTKQADLDEFFIGKRPYYYKGQNIYYGKRADAKMFERLEVIHGSCSGAGGMAFIEFDTQIHGETASMSASAILNCVASTNNILPVRLRGNYGFIEIEGYSPFDVAEIKMFRVHYHPIRPRGRVA